MVGIDRGCYRQCEWGRPPSGHFVPKCIMQRQSARSGRIAAASGANPGRGRKRPTGSRLACAPAAERGRAGHALYGGEVTETGVLPPSFTRLWC